MGIKEAMKQIENSKKMKVFFFSSTMVFLLLFYFFGMKCVNKKNDELKIERQDAMIDGKIYSDVELVEETNGEISFLGWALKDSAQIERMYLILQSGDIEQTYLLKKKERIDISEYYLQNKEIDTYGFCLSVDNEEILKDTCYEIQLFVCYRDTIKKEIEKTKIRTGEYYFNGELYTYNPIVFIEPALEGQYEEVVSKGIVRAFDLENQCWIYQYKTELYFITSDLILKRHTEKKLEIPVMPSTSIVELIPEHRKQYGFDHLGAFDLGELHVNSDGSSFYVQSVELPTNYPSTYVSTGIYDDTNKQWVIHFSIPMFDWRQYKNDNLGEKR